MAQNYKKPTKEELKKTLTPDQYSCTQDEETEPPFKNKYWNHKEDGIYVDIVSGEPLFSSLDKYDSGSGWPSFTKPLDDKSIEQKKDLKLFAPRVEVRSKVADSHLGHVFDDGPGPGGKRFCINSAALQFVSVKDLKIKGYSRFLFDFANKKHWEIATLSGGCFWGVEELIQKIPGVLATEVGYTGGTVANAHYEDVKKGTTGHAEAVNILFDPKITSYEKILLEFFKLHDPTTKNQQGNDVGTQYRSAVFFRSSGQKEVAQKVIDRVNKSGAWKKPVVTEINVFSDFWRAEEYHQDYLHKNPGGYTCHFVRKIQF